MTWRRRAAAAATGWLAAVGIGLGVLYLLVACESLPRWLGGVAGDAHPRTALGLAVLALAVGLGLSTGWTLRRRPP